MKQSKSSSGQIMHRYYSRLLAIFVVLTASLHSSPAQNGLSTRNLEAWRSVAQLHPTRSWTWKYHMRAEYPVFIGKTPLARLVGASVKGDVLAKFQTFKKQAIKDMAGVDSRHPPAWLPYTYDSRATLGTYSPRHLISLSTYTVFYSGGAHGMENTSTFNFGIVDGKPRRLFLRDLFVPGTNFRPHIEKAILTQMARRRVGNFALPDVDLSLTGTDIDPEDLNNFVIEKDGIRWIFDPYKMGSYADGTITVKLSPGELGPGVRGTLLWNTRRS